MHLWRILMGEPEDESAKPLVKGESSRGMGKGSDTQTSLFGVCATAYRECLYSNEGDPHGAQGYRNPTWFDL
jgi:hypothetical protein